ncbi:MAG TPA: HAD family hydrolase [Candidatus Limnocylindria bacterium]|nr:HAD family hydrolase [Candidatus Limnocylindria bacterium]
MIRALVFDFDGLILDTEMPAYQAWAEIFTEHGVELSRDRWHDYIGREGGWFDVYGHLEELLGRPVDRDALKARRAVRRDELIAANAMLHGVAGLFREAKLRGLKVGIASSSGRDWVCGHLERLEFMEGWDAIVCRDDVEHAKPAPDLYLRAAELLGVAPCEAVALEDSPNGVRAAKAAGLFCVAVPNPLTEGLDLTQADLRLSSLAELSMGELIRRLAR